MSASSVRSTQSWFYVIAEGSEVPDELKTLIFDQAKINGGSLEVECPITYESVLQAGSQSSGVDHSAVFKKRTIIHLGKIYQGEKLQSQAVHVFCADALLEAMSQSSQCPMCRASIGHAVGSALRRATFPILPPPDEVRSARQALLEAEKLLSAARAELPKLVTQYHKCATAALLPSSSEEETTATALVAAEGQLNAARVELQHLATQLGVAVDIAVAPPPSFPLEPKPTPDELEVAESQLNAARAELATTWKITFTCGLICYILGALLLTSASIILLVVERSLFGLGLIFIGPPVLLAMTVGQSLAYESLQETVINKQSEHARLQTLTERHEVVARQQAEYARLQPLIQQHEVVARQQAEYVRLRQRGMQYKTVARQRREYPHLRELQQIAIEQAEYVRFLALIQQRKNVTPPQATEYACLQQLIRQREKVAGQQAQCDRLRAQVPKTTTWLCFDQQGRRLSRT